MQISKNKVASLGYTLKNDKGDVLDQADINEPFIYLHGNGGIISGLEKHLEGKTVSDKFQATIPPEEAYGLKDDTLTQEIPREMFEGMDDNMLVAGAQFQAQTNAGVEVITIVKVENNIISIDANHQLAGETLHFDVEILAIREATDEEISHGHVHTSGGCGHDHHH